MLMGRHSNNFLALHLVFLLTPGVLLASTEGDEPSCDPPPVSTCDSTKKPTWKYTCEPPYCDTATDEGRSQITMQAVKLVWEAILDCKSTDPQLEYHSNLPRFLSESGDDGFLTECSRSLQRPPWFECDITRTVRPCYDYDFDQWAVFEEELINGGIAFFFSAEYSPIGGSNLAGRFSRTYSNKTVRLATHEVDNYEDAPFLTDETEKQRYDDLDKAYSFDARVQEFTARISILPYIFDTNGLCIPENGGRWAETPLQAAKYIAAHEMGHFEHYFAEKFREYDEDAYPVFQLVGFGKEEDAWSYASLVLRCSSDTRKPAIPDSSRHD